MATSPYSDPLMLDDSLTSPEEPELIKGHLHLKLGAAVLLRLSLLLITVSLIMFVALDQLLSSRFDSIDAHQYQHDIDRFAELVEVEAQSMRASLRDYAEWDDTYEFAASADPDYLANNFPDAETLLNLKMDGLILLAQDGKQLANLEIDAEGNQHNSPEPLQPELAGLLSRLGIVPGASQAQVLQLIWLNGRPLLLASQPIVNSLRNAPPRGLILMLRYLDGPYLQHAQQLTGSAPDLRPLTEGERPQAQSGFSEGVFSVSRPLFERAVWQLQGPTRLNSERRLTRWSLIISMAGLLLFTLIGLHWILRRSILQRLQHFAKQAEALKNFEDLSIRWPDAGRDELDSLGQALNQLISRVDTQQNALHKLAHQDALTQLSNRRGLIEEITRALIHCQRNERRAALLLLDLDNFKALNDSLGHTAGDQLLQHVATRLRVTANNADCVARLGGDEFVVLLEDLPSSAEAAALEAENLANKLLETIAQPCDVAGRSYTSAASLGITLFGDSLTTPEELLRQADIAMYRAKQSGSHSWRFFDNAMQHMVLERIDQERELRIALQEQQLSLHYQIQVNEIGQALGAEALLRWHHPQKGMISPAQFIPLAEETGLILPIGHWVLELACEQLNAWAEDPDLEPLSLAVNLSARQFHQPSMVEEIQDLLQQTGANPRRLKLELTESLLVDDMAQVINKMTALKALGIRFALDDFGTGYSSLAYLKRLPLDQLKIDQSFVRDILDDPNDAAIASMVISLAKLMNLEVIAEGVETEAQRAFLQERGCLAFQGYLFSRPLPLEAFEQQVRLMGSSLAGVTNDLISR